MAAYILSNALFYIKDILPITSGAGATFRISKDLERDLNIETWGVNAFVLLKNSAQIERMLVTCTGGVATIVKRGLEQDGITENANLKKVWWDGSIGYISVKPDDFVALGKLDTAWGLRTTMQSNSDKNALFIAGRTKLPIINADFSIGSGSTSSAAWIWTKTNWWYASWVWTWTASYDISRLKLQLNATGSYIEARSTDWWYNGITSESIPVEPNTTYTVEYDMETLYTSGSSTWGAKLAVLFQTSAWTWDWETSWAFVNTTTTNTHYSVTFTTWANTRYCNISPILYGHMGTWTLLMSAWFDNIVISCPSKELLKTITQKLTLSSEDEVFVENQDWTLSSVKYSVLQADMALAWGGSFSITPYESSITVWNPVWLTNDGLIKCTTENKSSANISASAINIIAEASLDTTRTFFLYSVWLTIYARVWTLSWDVMTYWTEVSVWTWSTGSMYGWCALINTDKVIVVFWDWTTHVWNLATHKVCTISWTTISQGTWATQSMVEWFWNAKTPLWVCKVRTDAYCLGYRSTNNLYYYISTVSWTTVTVNTTEFFSPNKNVATWPIYLSDNFIWISAFDSASNLIAYIYEVNSGSTAIANTYSTASFGNIPSPQIARVWNTEYILTLNNTTVYRIQKPQSWTTITAVNILTAPSAALHVCAVWPNHFGIINGTTVTVYTRSWELIGTLTWISSPASNSLYQYMTMVLWRWVYINWTNWTSRIVNFAKVFYFWIANNVTWWVLKRWTITISGIVINVKYYVQTDGSISDLFTDKYVGIGIATNTLLVW